ncbi:carbon-nitrogen hydrolase [Fennellomyces sp. T-0311]|nr:carbon-nitrogen hydrolase [Fennellomyces sp. T-0311]
MFFCLASDYLANRQSCAVFRVLVFPLLFTSIYFGIIGRGFGFGDGFVYSTSVLLGFPDIVQGVTWMVGRPGIDFVLALFATVVLETKTDKSSSDEAEQHATNWKKHPATWFTILVTLLALFGGSQIHIHRGSFFQVGYPEYVPKSIPVGCVIGPGGIDLELQKDYDRWFDRSATLVNAGAKLVMWSEETAATSNDDDEAALISRAQTFAQENNVYLAFTYNRTIVDDLTENKLLVITPQGEIAINYSKSHPVPLIEPIQAGKPEIPYIDTPEFGRVGVAICFDFNFPSFITQASKYNIDVMLQPSWTWGPIGTYHSRGNALRAVENGFTMLRCGSQGFSGVFEPALNGIYTQHVPAITDSEYIFHLPIQKRAGTLYGYTGDLFGFLCLITGVGAALYLTIKRFRDDQIRI